MYTFNLLSTPGTACILAGILGAFVVGLGPRGLARVVGRTAKQLALAELTLAAVLALAFLMNYSGMTATLGLAVAATGSLFPLFSPVLGFLGVFLTGSDTSANALFGTLQVVTAGRLHLNPILMAAANSAGGSTGKMISLTSIAVAAAATGLKREEEALLFRFTLKHALILTVTLSLIVAFFAYVAPGWVG
jgi:lactate permease